MAGMGSIERVTPDLAVDFGMAAAVAVVAAVVAGVVLIGGGVGAQELSAQDPRMLPLSHNMKG